MVGHDPWEAVCSSASADRRASRVLAACQVSTRLTSSRDGSADVPTMYHANGKQRGAAGNSGHLTWCSEPTKIDVYQEERLSLAEFS